jgi:cell surface protein SprA
MFMTGIKSDSFGFRFSFRENGEGLPILDFKDTNVADDKTDLDVLAVNQENGDRCPVNYIIPPGVQREQLYNNTLINQNEQSLSLRVSGMGWNQESESFFRM